MKKGDYFCLPVDLAGDPRFAALRRSESLLLLALACGYNGQHQTDGFIPARRVPLLHPFEAALEELIEDLLEVGIWTRVEGGFVNHYYLEWNPTAAEVRAKQEAANARRERSDRKARGEDVQTSLDLPEPIAIRSRRSGRDPIAPSPLLSSPEEDPSGGRAPAAPSSPVEGPSSREKTSGDGASDSSPAAPPKTTRPARGPEDAGEVDLFGGALNSPEQGAEGEPNISPRNPARPLAPASPVGGGVRHAPPADGPPRDRPPRREAAQHPEELTAWRLWREAYKARHGPYLHAPGDGKTLARLVVHAEQLLEDGLVDGGLEALLGHWFGSYLRRPGRAQFLEEARHPLQFLEAEIPTLGSPPRRRERPQAAPSARASPGLVRAPATLLEAVTGTWTRPRPSFGCEAAS